MSKLARVGGLLAMAVVLWMGMAAAAYAASIPPGYDVWDTKDTTDPQRSWTVEFNRKFDGSAVNTNNIFITDKDNNRIQTIIIPLTDSSVKVRPAGSYAVNDIYRLYITKNVRSLADGTMDAEYLSKPIIMPFFVKKTSPFILDVTSTGPDPFLHSTRFNVEASGNVHSISIDGMPMEYAGLGKFSKTIPGLRVGQRVAIHAYDGSGKLLDTIEHMVTG